MIMNLVKDKSISRQSYRNIATDLSKSTYAFMTKNNYCVKHGRHERPRAKVNDMRIKRIKQEVGRWKQHQEKVAFRKTQRYFNVKKSCSKNNTAGTTYKTTRSH